jgi:hypothetical protein
MDLKQKYTVDLIYEVEDYFMKKLQTDFDLDISLKIAELINQTVHQVLPVKKSLTSEGLYTVEFYGGVVHNLGIPTFFKLETESFIEEGKPLVALIDIKEIDSDEYLDLINSNKYLNDKLKYNQTKNRRTIRAQSS